MIESNKKYVIGLDFGTDSCRALIVDVRNGDEVATGISFYPRWKAGLYCDAQSNRYRQHPLDYIESMTEAVHTALSHLTEEEIASICGLCFDTTGSTPALTDCNGMPLALNPEFAEEPDAMFILWKDHTAVREAEQINALMKERNLDYLLYEGGTYSSEWVWSKVLHVINTNSKVKEAVYSWTEHCDWMTGLVTGNTIPEKMLRSRCAAGHKAMWHERWLLSSSEVLLELNPSLNRILPHLFTQTYTSDTRAGTLTAEWAGKLGLPQGIAVAVGALDAHMGAVGASVASGVLTRIMGTSTCDIMVAEKHEIGDRCIEGICGQVDGSVLPGFIGLEAGQSAFGDIYAWFGKFMSWPLKDIPEGEAKQKVMDTMLIELTREAQALKLSENDIVALDWMNGRRTPYADQNVKGMIAGLTLGSTAPEVFKALVEATAFGSRRIVEHMKSQRLQIDSVNAIGGISKKAPFVMQTLADVLGMPIRIVRSQQTCALGAAMFAAVAAGVYSTVGEAMRYMGSDIEIEYRPDTERKKIYEILYRKYLQLAKTSYT
ncbi:ribulokinase [Bacteroides intestinalis]|uniref:ribulokinase n=2 Tax=Bacteroides intestinalis TaxID=329854 RepID=UPI00142EC3E2|nr:ribulokinase [Bacteroides intestinalis]UCB36491.1 ribulokinase [Bacteroides intestinalis]UCB40733.1 ribulokinase [Bacteroides intestinalis]